MENTPVLPALDPDPLLAALQNGIKLNVSGTLPGEALMVALLNYATAVRSTMSDDLRKRFDAVTVQQVEDMQHVWRGIWQALGVIPKG